MILWTFSSTRSCRLSDVHHRHSINNIINRVKLLHSQSKPMSKLGLLFEDDTGNTDKLDHADIEVKSRHLSVNVNDTLYIPVYLNVDKCKDTMVNVTKILLPTLKLLLFNKSEIVLGWYYRYEMRMEYLICNYH